MDLQADFQVLKCHTDMATTHVVKFMDDPITNYCEETIGYGPWEDNSALWGYMGICIDCDSNFILLILPIQRFAV